MGEGEERFAEGNFEASIAIVVFLSVLAGVVITAIIVFSGRIKQYIKRWN